MDNITEKINELTFRINELARQQSSVSNQLIQLMNDLDALKRLVVSNVANIAPGEKDKTPDKVIEHTQVIEAPVQKPVQQDQYQRTPIYKPAAASSTPRPARPAQPSKQQTSFEEFIGKNVASKVGILITIIGIFIGAKYAIEHQMVSPVVRIISGYASGLVLIGFAIRLKKKYEAYSSVLMGGGLSVMYFITYTAYGFYGLLPQTAAFAIMLVLTGVIIYTALLYNSVLIAHLAQVGAYAIPFLLSDNSGRYQVLFSYIAIINAGILVLSFKKNWKSLFYVAFGLTWIIYGSWQIFEYEHALHFNMALLFPGIYFISFYVTFLAYRLARNEQFGFSDVMIILSNAFIYYGFGYAILHNDSNTENLVGAFTVVNAGIHLLVSEIIRRKKLADRSLYYLVFGLMIVFMTIAIPVQFDGNWVTLLWTFEAVLVFIIGRTRKAGAYERLGVGLFLLSFLSLAHDWINQLSDFGYNISFSPLEKASYLTPFANIIFITGILVFIAQGVIIYFDNKKYTSALAPGNFILQFYKYIVPAIFIVTVYFVFFIEIWGHFELLTTRPINGVDTYIQKKEIYTFASLALYLYTLAFSIIATAINRRWIKSVQLATTGLIGTVILLIVLLVYCLATLNIYGALYFDHSNQTSVFGVWFVQIRYIIFFAVAILLWQGRLTMKNYVDEPVFKNAWTLTIHTIAIWVINAEYLMWANSPGSDKQYKLGLTILWGVYALSLIVFGIWKKLKFLRLAAIIFFGITLLKLFLYDLSGAGTITKTISFISLGVILLLVSYLYNRYKEKLFGDEKKV